MTVRTRFAPSPTGYLHIGGVRTALFNWLFTRHHGGQFILRIDDTDQQRNVQEALQPILDGFRWLGIDWDEGPEVGGPHAPYFQSQRLAQYQQAVGELLVRGFAYRDFAKPEELKEEREKAEQEKRQFLYSRRYMATSEADVKRFEGEGRQGVVRLKMPREGKCVIDDLIRGIVEFDWASEQDHVIQRADGSCLYHLASVVDDRDFEITHVIRAEEHLSNTPRQIFIANGLGAALPKYAHLPYVAEPGSKNKLSKRKIPQYLKNADFKKLYDHGQDIAKRIQLAISPETFNPVVVDFYREVGYLPDGIINYLLLLGWSLDDKTEYFSREDMIRQFSLERVQKAPASFDPQKLWSFQDQHMRRLPTKKKVAMVLPYLQRAGLVPSPPPCDVGPKLTRILDAAGDRIKAAGDILTCDEFFVADDALVYDAKAFDKRLREAPLAADLLRKLMDELEKCEPFTAVAIEERIKNFVGEQGIKIGDIIHALRVAVTGKAVGIGMFESIEIIGRESCLARMNHSLARLTR